MNQLVFFDQDEEMYITVPIPEIKFFENRKAVKVIYNGPKSTVVISRVDFHGKLQMEDGTIYNRIELCVDSTLSADNKIHLPFNSNIENEDIDNIT